MSNQELLSKIVTLLGSESNIESMANCMTRLRVKVKNPSLIQKDAIQNLEGVLGVVEDETFQIIVGPGKANKLMELFKTSYSIPTSKVDEDWKSNKEKVQSKNKGSKFKQGLRTIGEIFIPLLPAIIAAGIFNGFAGLITNLQNTGSLPASETWNIIRLVLSLLGGGFLSYFMIFTGISAARVFGATEALGGMVGAMTVMTQIDEISKIIGLFNEDSPLNSILRNGKGGVIGVIVGVYLLSKIEKAVRKRVPDVLDLMLTPIVTLLVVVALLLVVIMPVTGLLSDWLVQGLELLVNSSNPVVSILSGYVLSALFLPMVLLGLHHGLIPIYAIQLEATGGVSLFPVLAMAGAGQVGAAIAIYFKAKKVKNQRLVSVISGALPAGFLGIGEPLIYGVTLPLGKPFITAGLGAGFGGAYVMLQKVMSTAWGPSGLTAIPLMQPNSMLNYFIGLVVSYIFGFIITAIFIKESEVANV